MPVVLLTMIESVGTVLLHMLTALITESFIKKAVILLLEKVVARTGSDLDNKLLEAAKEAWSQK